VIVAGQVAADAVDDKGRAVDSGVVVIYGGGGDALAKRDVDAARRERLNLGKMKVVKCSRVP
jgi:hypothetical protein